MAEKEKKRFRPARPDSVGTSGGGSPLHCAPVPNYGHNGTLSQNVSSDCFDVLSKGGHMRGPMIIMELKFSYHLVAL